MDQAEGKYFVQETLREIRDLDEQYKRGIQDMEFAELKSVRMKLKAAREKLETYLAIGNDHNETGAARTSP